MLGASLAGAARLAGRSGDRQLLGGGDNFSLGMMENRTIRRRGALTLACLATDDAEGLEFVMEPRGGGFFIRNVEPLSRCPPGEP